MNSKLFIASLPWAYDDQKLGYLFAEAGKVISAQVIMDRDSGRSKGFGFVEMSSPEEAELAIKKFNGYDCDGRKLVVNVARPQAPRENRAPRR